MVSNPQSLEPKALRSKTPTLAQGFGDHAALEELQLQDGVLVSGLGSLGGIL